MGLTEEGYKRRTYDDILNDKIQRAKELLGEDIDTSELSILGKYLRINAYDQAITEEELEAVYYARFPNTANGQSLDRLLPFVALVRNTAEAAVYSVTFGGEAGYTIPAGFLVCTDTGLTFGTDMDYTIGADGSCAAVVRCTEAGTIGNITASGINTIVNPDASVETVVGVECLAAGRDEESDTDLRVRFNGAVTGSGSCNANAIRSALLRIPTVRFVAVIENDGDTADADGRPPHSFECYVLGGDDNEREIAEVIFDKRPIGVKTAGDKAVTITDASGNERVVRYSTAQKVGITVRVQIRTNAFFPNDGVELVQNSIANRINGLDIGTSLVLSTLYGPIYDVSGVAEVVSLEVSTDGGSTYSAANVSIPAYGVAVFASANVEVVA